jgi:hypothetical protein
MIFSPDANQGPLIGILISGPAGAALGLVLGVLVSMLRPTDRTQKHLLALAGLCVALPTLYATMPSPKYLGRIIDAEMGTCSSASEAVPTAISYWEQRVAKVTWAPPRAGWQQELKNLAQTDPGVVLDMHVLRERLVYQNRKPWNRGSLVQTSWQPKDVSERFYARFAGADCSAYAGTSRAAYFPVQEQQTSAWPPLDLPTLLNLLVLDTVPYKLQELAKD